MSLVQIHGGGQKPVGDIVLIHGLYGDVHGTWMSSQMSSQFVQLATHSKHHFRFWMNKSDGFTSRQGQTHDDLSDESRQNHPCYWPKDFLAQDFANHRIFACQYRSDVGQFLGEGDQPGSAIRMAKSLLSQIVRVRKSCYFRPLAFVYHTLGGCLAYLVCY